MFSNTIRTSNESIARNITRIFPNVIVGQDAGHLSIHVTVEAARSLTARHALGTEVWSTKFFRTSLDLEVAVFCANQQMSAHWSDEQEKTEERRQQVSLLARAAGISASELESRATINVRYQAWSVPVAAAEFANWLAGEALDCDDPIALMEIMRHPFADDTVSRYAADCMTGWLTEDEDDAEFEVLMSTYEDNSIHDIWADMLAA